jgi:hypothetical protein
MNTKRIGLLALVLAVIAAVLVWLGIGSAQADEGRPIHTCITTPGWTEEIMHDAIFHEEEIFDHWQRYSWTGGPWESDEAPPFPSDNWQPNVQGDPHGIGVEGAYFVSHGGSGNGDWFYLEAVTKTVTVVDEEAWTEYIEHPPVTTCPPVPEEPENPFEPVKNPPRDIGTPIQKMNTPAIPTVVDSGL